MEGRSALMCALLDQVSPQGMGEEAGGPPRPLEKGEPKKEGEEKVLDLRGLHLHR